MIDYHIHTSLCNHARGRMEDYILHAIKKGLIEICFMDHLTLQGEGAANTMQPSEVPLYFQAIQVLKEKYTDKISIKAGLEVDFDENLVEEIENLTNIFAFDAIGASVHFSGGLNLASRKSRNAVEAGNVTNIIKSYIEKLDRMLDFDFFDIICHIDLPKKFMGKAFSVFPFVLPILKKTAEKGKAVEINTSGFYHPCGEFYPEEAILSECFRLGIPVTLGSDSHRPEETGRDLELALKMAKNVGYKKICTFKKRKMDLINC